MVGFVIRRIRGRLPLAVAMLLTVLISTTVLTALLDFGRTVGDAGVQRALQGPGHDRTVVLVSGDQGAGRRTDEAKAVTAFARTLFGRFPVSVDAASHSRSYGLPGVSSTGGSDPDLTRLAALDRDRVQLLSGSWPARVAGPRDAIQVAVPQTELTRLRLKAQSLPARVRLSDRYGGAPITVTVTGVYRARDPYAPYWQLDPFGGREIVQSGFVSYGPMLVDDTVFTSGALLEEGRNWLLSPDLSTILPAEADALRGRVDQTVADFQHGSAMTAQTQLDGVLDDVRAGAQVSQADEMIGSLQLAVLAAAALLLVVQLMATRQATEDSLLAARGATRHRIGVLTAGQSLLLAAPAAVFAPPLTPPLLRLLGHGYGPIAQVHLDTSLTWRSWLTAGVCALAGVALCAAPALGRGATGLLQRAGRRQALVGGVARSGADLAVIALAALAFQELRRYSSDAGKGLGIDPVAVAAPTLALCAGTIVVLRLLPFAARLGGRIAARGSGLSAALVGWQLSRRSGRTAGPTLLLVLAVATGVLAVGQHASWSVSQTDQASFATAGGLRIWDSTVPPLGQGGRYGTLPGGSRIIPVARTDMALPNGGDVQVLALDAAGAGARLSIRSDLRGGRSMHDLFAPLAQAAPSGAAAGVPIPGRPARIELAVSSHLDRITMAPQADGTATEADQPGPVLMLQLRDRFGAVHVVPMSDVPLDGDAAVSANLSAAAGAPLGQPAWPLTLVGVEIEVQTGAHADVTGELTVHQVLAAQTLTGPAATVPLPSGLAWNTYTPPDPTRSPSAGSPFTSLPGSGVLSVIYAASGEAAATFSASGPGGGATAAGTGPVPVLATYGYLSAVGAKVGDVIPLTTGADTVDARVVAAVDAIPTAGDIAVAVDLATLTRRLAVTGSASPEPTEWWLPAASPQDHTPAQAAADLRTRVGTQNLQLQQEMTAQRTDDPLSAGPQVTLIALAVVAAILAAIGFAAATAAAASERAREHAILLALGCAPRQLARTAAAEPALLIALGAAVGLGIGALMVRLVVPLVVLTPAAQRPVPPVVVTLPLGWTLALVAAITVVPVLTAFLSGRRSAAARPRSLEEL